MIKLLNYLNTYSPYYIKLFNKHNYDINTFKHITDITQIPTTSKYNLQASNWDFLCVDKSKIIEYWFFVGLTHEEIAEIIGMSLPTVRKDWRLARAWLSRELKNKSI